MRHGSIADLARAAPRLLAPGPVALILAEDGADLDGTLAHHLAQGFGAVVALLPPDLPDPAISDRRLHLCSFATMAPDAAVTAVNTVAAALPGVWLYWGYNAEYLFYPFCETRSIRDLVTFHAEERREAMVCFGIDLYPADLAAAPDGVDRAGAMFDATGYFALGRHDADGQALERQLDAFGGLRWRFEQFLPWERRRIDRIALFRARPGVMLRADDLLSDEEANTYACPWHHNLTAAVASFRVAKALRTNPGSRAQIARFRWRHARPFAWDSRQLLDLGLMEPGQWF